MGCDIHLIAEARDDEGNWQLVPGPVVDCWSCDGTGKDFSWAREPDGRGRKVFGDAACTRCSPDGYLRKLEVYDEEAGEYSQSIDDPLQADLPPGKYRDEWFSDRNYDVFAILGNVRNGRGFAGVHTREGFFRPISDARGLPDDLSAEGRQWFEHHGGDHSDTWVDLIEVLAYEWDEPVRKVGWVDVENFRTYLQRGEPDSWSGDISGGLVRKISNEEMRDIVTGKGNLLAHPDLVYVTHVQWTWTCRSVAESFLERMKMLLEETGERQCRLVMNFDS